MSAEVRRWAFEGPALVLVHGAGGNAHVWEPVARELSAFDVYAPSLPGRGETGGRAFERADEAGRWIAAQLAELGLADPILVGHSYGGAVAMEAVLSGAQVGGLVLVASGARLRVHPGVLQSARQSVETREPMPVRFAFTAATDEAIAGYEARVATTPPEAALADWRACDGFDRMGALGSLDAPTLVVGGLEDPLTPPKYQRYLVEQLPRAQLELVPGRGHMLPWEDSPGFASLVRSFAAAC